MAAPDPALGRERFDLVIHSAGVLRDGLARTLTPERIAEVLAPKISGVQALDAMFDRDHRPGAVVLFGSISAVEGIWARARTPPRTRSSTATRPAAATTASAGGASTGACGTPGWARAWSLRPRPRIPALEPDAGLALLREVLARPPGQYVLSAPARPKDEPMTSTLDTTDAWTSVSAILTGTMHLPRSLRATTCSSSGWTR